MYEPLTADLDHVTRILRSNLASQLEEDPTEGPGMVIDCGSNLLNWFCKLNWIGPLQPALQFPFPEVETLVGGATSAALACLLTCNVSLFLRKK